MKALLNAANGIGGPTTFNFDEYYSLLSLDKTEELTTSSLNKAYRKAALKNHPDKGGNVDAFKKVQEAFEILQSKLAEEEQSKFYKNIGFSADIEKVCSAVAGRAPS
jgi:curved DNA-binding protein CbpA